MSHSPEKELLGAVFTILNETELKTQTGINPATGAARAVGVYNMPPQDAAMPFVRFSISDTIPLSSESYDIESQPTAKTIFVTVDCFSEYEPELLTMSARVQALLQHAAIVTLHFTGSSWFTAADYLVENETDPDRVIRHAALRMRCNLEPNA
jgi:hypothetical protein